MDKNLNRSSFIRPYHWLLHALMAWLLLVLLGVVSTVVVASSELKVIVNYYEIKGINPIGEEETAALLKPYTGQHISLNDIQQAVTALQNKLTDMGYGFYQINLVPQELDKKFILLHVDPLNITKINISMGDNPDSANATPNDVFFSHKNIKNSVPALVVNQSPNLDHVAQQVELANLNPAKKINVLFSVDEETNESITADISVKAVDPVRYFGWLDNTGSEETGDYRLGLGYKNYNLFDSDHELIFTYTTSPDYLDEVKQYGLNYRIPLYHYQSTLQLYANYSDVDSGTIAGGFDVSGKGTFVGMKYEWYLPREEEDKKYTDYFIFGLDDKQFNNDVFFGSVSLGTDVRSTPLSIAYKGKWKALTQTTDFYLQYEHNIETGSYNSDKYYALSRSTAQANWDVFKLGLTHNLLLSGYRVISQLDIQLTDQELISGEQFGLGGLSSKLRGFKGREVSGDKGIKGSIELWAPAMFNQQVNFLGFIDAGYAEVINPLPSEVDSDTLVSAGVGAILHWKNIADLSLYLAHVIDGVDAPLATNATQDGDSAVHFTLSVNY